MGEGGEGPDCGYYKEIDYQKEIEENREWYKRVEEFDVRFFGRTIDARLQKTIAQ